MVPRLIDNQVYEEPHPEFTPQLVTIKILAQYFINLKNRIEGFRDVIATNLGRTK